jgi:zinc protease
MSSRVVLLAVVVFVAGLALHAQEKSTPKPKGPVDLTPVKELPPGKVISRQDLGDQTTLARLGNGVTVIVREHHVAPVATARVYVSNTGSAYEGKWLGSGISHLVEHLVSGGTTKHRTGEQIEALVNSIGGSSNAYTSTDVTAYYLDVPARHISPAIDLLADAMQHCTFPEKEFTREYHVVQRELEMGEEERSRVMWNMLSQLAYREHPLRHPVIGYLPVLQKLTRDDVLAFYRERYQPQNMTFVVAGAIKTDAILEEISKRFGDFKRSAEITIPLPVEPPLASPRSQRRQMEGELSTVTLAWPTVSLEHPDLYPLDVAATILGSGDSSRLARRLRFEQKLVVSVQASSYTPPGAPGWFQISFECQPKNVEKARVEVVNLVRQFRLAKIPEAELAKAKKQTLAAFVFGRQSVEQLAESLSSGYRNTGDPLFDAHYTSGIRNVREAELGEVLRKYFQWPEPPLVAVIDPLDANVTRSTDTAKVDTSKVQKHTLPNGLTVLIRRSTAVPLVHMQCLVKGGLLAEANEQNGLSNLTADLMTRGTRKYAADQIAEFFDSIGGSIESTSGQHTTYVTCEALKEDFSTAFDYFAEVALRPTFPGKEFEDRKEERLLAIGQRRADTFSEAAEFFHDQVPPESYLHRIRGGRKETVTRLTAEDCKRFHAAWFVPRNMVVTVFGDVDPAQALKLATEQFGTLKPVADFKFPVARGFSLDQAKEVEKKTRRPDAAVIYMGFPSTSMFDHQENMALIVLRTILTGYDGGGGWLFNDLRGAGLVYVITAMNRPTLVKGCFSVVAQTRPDQVPEALKRIKANLAKAAGGEFSDAEFNRAKEAILNGHARENETLTEQAMLAGIHELVGLGFDFEDKFEEQLRAVTLADVKTAARKLFDRGLVVTTGPAK